MKLNHSSSATGVPNAPYRLLPAIRWRYPLISTLSSSKPIAPISAATTTERRGGSTPGSSVSR